jgi:hypothetical protein
MKLSHMTPLHDKDTWNSIPTTLFIHVNRNQDFFKLYVLKPSPIFLALKKYQGLTIDDKPTQVLSDRLSRKGMDAENASRISDQRYVYRGKN